MEKLLTQKEIVTNKIRYFTRSNQEITIIIDTTNPNPLQTHIVKSHKPISQVLTFSSY